MVCIVIFVKVSEKYKWHRRVVIAEHTGPRPTYQFRVVEHIVGTAKGMTSLQDIVFFEDIAQKTIS